LGIHHSGLRIIEYFADYQLNVKMARERSSKLVITAVMFIFLLNFPILSLVDKEYVAFGFPILYLYLFGMWASLIIITALLIRKRNK
jgi:hypothetical protein